jgi:hypothetical protein
MSAKFERWKRSYNRKLSYYGVPENEHTDKMARVYFMAGYNATDAAYDEMHEYLAYKRELRRQDKLAWATLALECPATVPVEVNQEENTK